MKNQKLPLKDLMKVFFLGEMVKGRKYNLGINLGFGWDLIHVHKCVIFLEPNIKIQTMPYSAKKVTPPFDRYLYTIGFTVNTKFGL